jgi:hypothetical protein
MPEKHDWKSTALGIAIAIALVVAYRAWTGPVRITVGFVKGQMPPCDSTAVRHLLSTTFASSPEATKNGVKLIKIGHVRDRGHSKGDPVAVDPEQEARSCSAVIFTNAGKDDLDFQISWLDGTKSAIWLESE